MFNNADFILNKADLLSYNKRTHDIEVDKYIVDLKFKEGELVYIRFTDDDESIVREYEMVSEDKFGIVLGYVCEYED